jgi:hypothetical protein
MTIQRKTNANSHYTRFGFQSSTESLGVLLPKPRVAAKRQAVN